MGKLTVFSGDPGEGKSFVTDDIAARVSRGDVMPDGTPGPPRGSVIILACEDGIEDTIAQG